MWSAVLSWAVQAFIIAALIGAAFGVLSMTPPQFILGQAFFTVAAIIAVARIGWWLGFEHSQPHSWQRMLALSFILFGVIGCAWYAAVRWIEELKAVHLSQKTRTISAPAVSPRHDELVRDKVASSLGSCSLEGIRLLRQIYDSGMASEGDLQEAFDASVIESAERTLLLEKRTGRMVNEDREVSLYRIREEYRPVLDEFFSSKG